MDQDISVKTIDDRLQSIENSLSAINLKLATTKDDQDAILDIVDAAKLIRSTPGTLYSRVRLKTIPFIRDGSRVLFSRQALLSFLSSKEIRQDAAANGNTTKRKKKAT